MTRLRSTPLVAALVLLASAGPALADGDAARIETLEQRIRALEARIAALEAHRTFATFMPNFAERFHVMHRAGEAGDWAVASHELSEMKRLSSLSTSINAEQGRLMQSMMTPVLDELEAAIGHTDDARFAAALEQAIDTCNACHAATGSAFIEVRLDASELISLRHPHHLRSRDAPEGHTHQHGMHDDAGRPKHKH